MAISQAVNLSTQGRDLNGGRPLIGDGPIAKCVPCQISLRSDMT